MMPLVVRRWWRRQQFRPGPHSILFNPSYLLRRRLLLALRERLSQPCAIVVDVGCGSKPYQELIPAISYIGVEVRQAGHDHAQEQVDSLYDGSRLPIASASADLVLCSEVLEHAAAPAALVQDMMRVLRPGGRLVITTPFAWGEHERPHDEQRWTWYGLRRLLDENGCSDIEIQRVGHYMEAVFQLFAAYVHQRLLPRSKLINALCVPFSVTPLLVLGRLGALLPAHDCYYMNLVAVARKRTA